MINCYTPDLSAAYLYVYDHLADVKDEWNTILKRVPERMLV